ncbi:hypothetical protein R4Z10_17885 [Niallia sp. XMNu-256]
MRDDEKTNDSFEGSNRIREKLKERNSTVFTSAARRRLALLHEIRDR